MTQTVGPVERGGVLIVDLVALAPLVGLQSHFGQDVISVLDPAGTEWHGHNGGLILEAGPGRSLALSVPIQIHGTSALLPLEAVASLANLQLAVDRPHQQVTLLHSTDTAVQSPAGWQPLILEKTAEEKAEEAHEASAGNPQRNFTAHLPPAYDSLRMQLGIGYVQGADSGI